jgi:hypothetical protein
MPAWLVPPGRRDDLRDSSPLFHGSGPRTFRASSANGYDKCKRERERERERERDSARPRQDEDQESETEEDRQP